MRLNPVASLDDIPPSVCYLSPQFGNNLDYRNRPLQQVEIRFRDTSSSLRLNARFVDWVDEADVVVSLDVITFMQRFDNQLHQNGVEVVIVELSMRSVQLMEELQLRYVSVIKLSSFSSALEHWSSDFSQLPPSIESVIADNFIRLCDNIHLSHNQYILIPFLSSVMAFQVIAPDTLGSILQIEKLKKLSFKTTNEVMNTIGSNNVKNGIDNLSPIFASLVARKFYFASNAVNRILGLVDNIFSSPPGLCGDGYNYNSVLLQGPKGIGKSFMLRAFHEYCLFKQSSACSDSLKTEKYALCNQAEVLFIDCQEIVRRNIRPPSSLIQSDLSLADILTSLRTIASQSHSTSTPALNGNLSVIIFIDSLDEVFSLFNEESIQDRSAMADISMNNTRHFLAFLMYHLLLKVKVPQVSGQTSVKESESSVTIFGACGTPQYALPRSSSGSPEFETVISLPKPTKSDRQLLWSQMIQYFFQLQNMTNQNNHAESIMSLSLVAPSSDDSTDRILNTEDEWTTTLAEATRGYLPADLMHVLESAVQISSRASNTSQNQHISPATVSLYWESLTRALAEVMPASVLDVSLEMHPDLSSSLSWHHFIGYTEAKRHAQRIAKMISYNGNNTQKKSLLGRKRSKGMVVYGASGCGKSYLIQTMAKELKLNFISVTGGDLLSKYFGDTEARIRSIFQRARSAAPCILYFDNFDSLAHRRGTEDGTSTTSSGNIGNRILSTFLNELDGIGSETVVEVSAEPGKSSRGDDADEQVVFVAVSCSDLSNLDEALVRPGRLQHHVQISYPDTEDVSALLQYFFRNSPVHRSVDFHTIAQKITERCVSAAYKEKYLSVTKLLDFKEQVITLIMEEFLFSNATINEQLQLLSKEILRGTITSTAIQPLVTKQQVSSLQIRDDHFHSILNKLFPQEKPPFAFAEPFQMANESFSFNIGTC